MHAREDGGEIEFDCLPPACNRGVREQMLALFRIYIITPYNWYFESDAFDMLVNANLYAPKEMAIYWKDFENGIRGVLDEHKKKRSLSSKKVAQVLVNFARDSRRNSKNARELERLVLTAIQLAIGL